MPLFPYRVDCCAAVPVQGPLLFLYRATAVPLSSRRPTAMPLFLYRAIAVSLCLYRARCYSCTERLLCRCSCTGPTAILVQDYCCATVPAHSCTGRLPLLLYRTHCYSCCAAIPVQGPKLCRYSHTGPTAVPLFLYRAHCCAAILV